mmetsp:Transcript_52886/g.140617  ORF Transcript_52886/g.140617 Transcript_52886/m.140617 type:complete len:187 (-) Transcript_52886:161-721(-)
MHARALVQLVLVGVAVEDVSHSKTGNCMLQMRGSKSTAPADGADVDPASTAVLGPGAEFVDWHQLVEAEAHHPDTRAIADPAAGPTQGKVAADTPEGDAAAGAEARASAAAQGGRQAGTAGAAAPVLLGTSSQALALATTTAQRAWSGFKWLVVTFGNPAHGPLGYAPLSTLQAKTRKAPQPTPSM